MSLCTISAWALQAPYCINNADTTTLIGRDIVFRRSKSKKRAAALHKLNPLSASDLDVQPVERLLRFVQLCRHRHTTAVMGISM